MAEEAEGEVEVEEAVAEEAVGRGVRRLAEAVAAVEVVAAAGGRRFRSQCERLPNRAPRAAARGRDLVARGAAVRLSV